MSPSQFPITVDLRSDTVTRPTRAMRDAMAAAPVGDDVYADDPTVERLQQTTAQLLGKEAGLFLPSGTQSNLCAVMAHCGRGDEYIIGDQYHVYRHEAGGSSILGSAFPCPIPTAGGAVSPDDVRAAIKPDDAHYPTTRLLCLENTVSGAALTLEQLREPAVAARAANLQVHLDGARLFNAAIELDLTAAELAQIADTVSVCLSKGLGAPVGSVLVGSQTVIKRAHRLRKMLGGGMRQAGVIAAGGLHAIEHHIDRLAQDHKRATTLGTALNELDTLWQKPVVTQTNMVFIEPLPRIASALYEHLAAANILVGRPDAVKRLVMHLDIDDSKLNRVVDTFRSFHKGQS